jgi:hypothetical protein
MYCFVALAKTAGDFVFNVASAAELKSSIFQSPVGRFCTQKFVLLFLYLTEAITVFVVHNKLNCATGCGTYRTCRAKLTMSGDSVRADLALGSVEV